MSRSTALAEPQTQPTDGRTDDEVVQAIRAGDEAAFASLFERHRRFVTRVIGRFFSRPQDVEELVQEVFTEAFLGLPRYRGGRPRSFVAWLKCIAVTTCYDALRAARARDVGMTKPLGRHEMTALNGLFDGVRLSAEESVIVRDVAEKLLARLSPEDRLVVTLLSTEEASIRDIANLTGWSVAKVKIRAFRARRSLRALVKTLV
jgi:RNA polymerase sigma-70 factor (ECF subfamily)